MKEWLKNSWYVVARASELSVETQPLKKKVLGQNLALFIDSAGRFTAVNDVCPHMGASLSLGCVKNGNLVCPYHNFGFGSDGKCAEVPSIVEKGKIPSTLMVDSYPIVEKYGLLWIFMGDTPEDKRPPIVSVPEFDLPEFRKLYHDLTWRGSVRPMLENLIDFTHFSYLHAATFGNGDHPYRGDYKVTKGEYEVSCTVNVKLNPANWFFPPVPELGENPDVKVFCRYHVPTLVVNDFSIGKYKDVTLFTFTPIDDNEVLIRMYGCRNFDKSDVADTALKNLGERILEEDRLVIESCVPEVLPHAVSVPVDKYLLAARNLYDKVLKAGNSVQDHVFETHRGGRLTILPSPVRTANASFGRSWKRRETQEKNARKKRESE
jgi:phenylpropionate dioxygenase-like ring-hydroxylating dioxygenase large terminal subunit